MVLCNISEHTELLSYGLVSPTIIRADYPLSAIRD
jgi:hypothetical protein